MADELSQLPVVELSLVGVVGDGWWVVGEGWWVVGLEEKIGCI